MYILLVYSKQQEQDKLDCGAPREMLIHKFIEVGCEITDSINVR
jgi:hypothetical protein